MASASSSSACAADAFEIKWKENTSCENAVTIMQYNMLAQCYCKATMLKHIDDGRLRKWRWRRKRLLLDVQRVGPHILCAQEMDNIDYWKSSLSSLGMLGVCARRPRRSEGAAIFFDASRFELLSHREFSLNDLSAMRIERAARAQEAGDEARRIELASDAAHLMRNNVALACALRDFQAQRVVVVATAHLFWDPSAAYVKQEQMEYVLCALRVFVDDVSEQHSLDAPPPLLFAGDFNSLPESAIYALLSTGSVEASAKPRRDMRAIVNSSATRGASAAKLPPVADKRAASLYLSSSPPSGSPLCPFAERYASRSVLPIEQRLVSAYADHGCARDDLFHEEQRPAHIEEPAFTNATPTWRGTIDYIFASADHFDKLDHIEMPSLNAVGGGLPHEHQASDHLPLAVRYQYR
jgi:mRNA deadenylase 3'-5' endonuclease subunit Ccr4